MKHLSARRTIILALFVIVLLSPCAVFSTRGPSTPEERARAVDLVEFLESRPTAPEAREARKWLVSWLAEVPDLTVTVCLDPLGSSRDLEGVPADLTFQQVFSQAAFLIRILEAKGGSVEAYVAGVEGALRAYEAMRESDAVHELKVFEELKRERAAGKLVKVVEKRVKKCK